MEELTFLLWISCGLKINQSFEKNFMLALRVEHLSKKFKQKGRIIWAVKDFNLEVWEREIFALLGPNGAGKTTFINLILTILLPDEGRVEIFGENPFVRKEVLQEVNFVPMERPTSLLTVKNFLVCYARLYGATEEKVEILLKELGLQELKEKVCWSLSTGESSKLLLAKSLLNQPKLLILDEPMFGLDPKARSEIRGLLQKLNEAGTTILFASHDVVEVERLASRIAFIKEGRIMDTRRKDEVVEEFGSVERYWLKLGR